MTHQSGGLMRHAFTLLATVSCLTVGAAARAESDQLSALVANPQRAERNVVRDRYRHPAEVLEFFGVTDRQTVVEILPGGSGYWTEILGPLLHDHGTYYAALPLPEKSEEAQKGNEAFDAKLASDPAHFGKVIKTPFGTGAIAPPGSADLVVTFRNVHNWLADGTVDAVFKSFFTALKPGGRLGIEEHRGRTDQPQDPAAKNGYVRQDYIIALAEKAGFLWIGSSEINANPRDTKDYPRGVWTLPPSYELGDQDRAKYQAIGESDRAVLLFLKPVR